MSKLTSKKEAKIGSVTKKQVTKNGIKKRLKPKSKRSDKINWGLLIKDNRKAVEDFIGGVGIRHACVHMKSKEAKSECYSIEKRKGWQKNARSRAKAALTRFKNRR